MEKPGIWKRTWNWLTRAFAALSANKYTTVAGALTFFLVMSIVPFLFYFSLLFGRTGLRPEAILELKIFEWAKDLLLLLLENAEGASASRAGVVFLATTLWSSSAFFYHLRRSGEILYAYRRQNRGWRVRLSAILLTLLILGFFLLAASALIGTIVLMRGLWHWLSYLVLYSLLFVIGFFASWILNSYICPYRCRFADILPGSFFTALAWLVASGVFSVYFAFGNRERLYGALTFVVVFLIWLYWMMICFTAGAIYNRHHMKTRGLEHRKF